MAISASLLQTLQLMVAVRNESRRRVGEDRFAFLGHVLQHLPRSHAQLAQDLWVSYELKGLTNGFFVEFGAADGVKDSNTYFLERELGWRGVLAEPGRFWWPAIQRNRACFVDRRCVWTATGERLRFLQPAVQVNATLESYADDQRRESAAAEGASFEVETVTLNDLLAHWGAPKRIDYMSVDTEGSEFDILSAFDFDTYDVRLMTVEHNHDAERRDKLHALLTSKGFVRKFETLSDFDDWYVRAY